MTLNNARRRFEELGCEVTRDIAPYRYKWRRMGTLAWRRHSCLHAMLTAATFETARVTKDLEHEEVA